MFNNEKGFTLVEVLIAIAVLSIGILAMQAMQGISIDENATSSRISKKSTFASSQIEHIIGMDYNDPSGLLDDSDNDGTNQDNNLNGFDDNDDANPNTINADEEFGLRHWQCCPGGTDPLGNPVAGCGSAVAGSRAADHCAAFEEYFIYWNVAVDHPIPNTKTINILVVKPGVDPYDPNRMPEHRAEYTYVKDDII